MYFTLTGNILSIANNANNWTVTATVQGDTTYPSLPYFMGNTTDLTSGSNFIWSPNATTTAVTGSAGTGSADWTNGYGVTGLPSTGI